VVPLHNISILDVVEGTRDDPVEAFTRWEYDGDVWIKNGRHRVLRALLTGQEHVNTRLLVIEC
jgi:hypothetical protein